MNRRKLLLGGAALGACTGAPMRINQVSSAPPLRFEDTAFSVAEVTDVSKTDLGGTVLYDEAVPFDIGSFTPPSSTTGPSGSGGRIKGTVQSRVVLSSNRNTLIFAYRFRDMRFWPGSGANKAGGNLVFVELVTLRGFPKTAFPVELYSIDKSQSLGAEPLGPLGQVGQGQFEFNTFLTEPGGTTFFEVMTQATRFKTGRFMDVGISTINNGGGLPSVTLDRIAVPV